MKSDLPSARKGFTLLELMIGVAIIGILASIATPNYLKFRDRARGEMALTGIKLIEKKINQYFLENGKYPDDLSVIGMDGVLDPWGRPFIYQKIAGCEDDKKNNGKKKSNLDNSSGFETYLACLRLMSLESKFLVPGINAALMRLVESEMIFRHDGRPALVAKNDRILLAKKDKEGKGKKDKEDKDKEDKGKEGKGKEDKEDKDKKDQDDKEKKDKKDKDDKDKNDKDDPCKNVKTRKDHSLHPINSDYDLYSMGKDGKSSAPLTAKISQDDIIRANNGGYIGVVSDY